MDYVSEPFRGLPPASVALPKREARVPDSGASERLSLAT